MQVNRAFSPVAAQNNLHLVQQGRAQAVDLQVKFSPKMAVKGGDLFSDDFDFFPVSAAPALYQNHFVLPDGQLTLKVNPGKDDHLHRAGQVLQSQESHTVPFFRIDFLYSGDHSPHNYRTVLSQLENFRRTIGAEPVQGATVLGQRVAMI